MRALLQRVRRASVVVGDESVAAIETGLLVFLGIHPRDDRQTVRWLSDKALNLRIFDERGKMNRSVLDIEGGIMVVSQFTLYAEAASGRRPNFSPAASREVAEPLYEYFVDLCRVKSDKVVTGRFGAPMEVSLVNWGPVTVWIDSADRKRDREQGGDVTNASRIAKAARHSGHTAPRVGPHGEDAKDRH